MTVRTHEPLPRRSVRPPDLPRAEREALRGRVAAPPRAGRRELGTLPMVAIALVLAFLLKAFVAQAFFIPSGSMIPTLEIGDRVLVEKISMRFGDPQRGDIVVFQRPGVGKPGGPVQAVREFLQGLGLMSPDADIDLIKRVMGLPGETVELRDGVVHIDGVALREPYALLDGRNWGPMTLPPERYFMLGDNRGNSDDSRFTVGAVPRGNIIGRAFVIVWPPRNATFGLRAAYPGGAP